MTVQLTKKTDQFILRLLSFVAAADEAHPIHPTHWSLDMTPDHSRRLALLNTARFAGLAGLATIPLLSACGGGGGNSAEATVAEQVRFDSRYSILNEALIASGLNTTLSGAGPFTLFAPTDAAFAALLGELGLSKAELLGNLPLLTAVLTYHVVPARVLRAGVPLGKAVTTVQGGVFKVEASGSELLITDGRNRSTRISATDSVAANGVVHTVDRVLLPANRNIVETAIGAAPEFSILVEAVVAANLQGALSGAGPLTVFAPTNAAFAALLTELGFTKAQLLANTALLTRVLTYHVVSGRVLKADIVPGQAVATLQGQSFTVGADLFITDTRARRSRIAGTDLFTSNGVIHTLERVLLPN
jgi:uncharacterized surface protein with fasciclin (FAS1) repeats